MARLQSPERAIGRGEVAESQLEAPIFTLLMGIAAIGLAGVHLYYQSTSLTIADTARNTPTCRRTSRMLVTAMPTMKKIR